MGALYNQLLERLDRVTTERDAALADAQCQKTKAEELNWEFERLSKAASKKIESLEKDLAQAISERTPHDYGILKEEAQEMRKQRDEARDEVEQLKQALHDARLENSGQAAQLEKLKSTPDYANRAAAEYWFKQCQQIRPEPSRLEIAAMLLQGLLPMHVNSTDVDAVALKLADRLIAAAKEGK
jgi:chromosome segregation ATPase